MLPYLGGCFPLIGGLAVLPWFPSGAPPSNRQLHVTRSLGLRLDNDWAQLLLSAENRASLCGQKTEKLIGRHLFMFNITACFLCALNALKLFFVPLRNASHSRATFSSHVIYFELVFHGHPFSLGFDCSQF